MFKKKNAFKVAAAFATLASLQGCFNSEINAAKDHKEGQFGRLEDTLNSRPYCSDQKWTSHDGPEKSVIVTNTCLVKIDPEVFRSAEQYIRKASDEQAEKLQNRLRESLENAQRAVEDKQSTVGPYEQFQYMSKYILPRQWEDIQLIWKSRVEANLATDLPQRCQLQAADLKRQ